MPVPYSQQFHCLSTLSLCYCLPHPEFKLAGHFSRYGPLGSEIELHTIFLELHLHRSLGHHPQNL